VPTRGRRDAAPEPGGEVVGSVVTQIGIDIERSVPPHPIPVGRDMRKARHRRPCPIEGRQTYGSANRATPR